MICVYEDFKFPEVKNFLLWLNCFPFLFLLSNCLILILYHVLFVNSLILFLTYNWNGKMEILTWNRVIISATLRISMVPLPRHCHSVFIRVLGKQSKLEPNRALTDLTQKAETKRKENYFWLHFRNFGTWGECADLWLPSCLWQGNCPPASAPKDWPQSLLSKAPWISPEPSQEEGNKVAKHL